MFIRNHALVQNLSGAGAAKVSTTAIKIFLIKYVNIFQAFKETSDTLGFLWQQRYRSNTKI